VFSFLIGVNKHSSCPALNPLLWDVKRKFLFELVDEVNLFLLLVLLVSILSSFLIIGIVLVLLMYLRLGRTVLGSVELLFIDDIVRNSLNFLLCIIRLSIVLSLALFK
jgi:hypothetical protein